MPSVLPVPVPATMPKPWPDAASCAQLGAVLPLEQGLDVGQPEGQLDGLAGGAGGRDDDDPAARVRRATVGVGIGREVVIAGGVHGGKLTATSAPASRTARRTWRRPRTRVAGTTLVSSGGKRS